MNTEDQGLAVDICQAFERQFPMHMITSYAETRIPALPASIRSFILTIEPKNCICGRPHHQEVIALLHGKCCGFLTAKYYDRLDSIALEVLRASELP